MKKFRIALAGAAVIAACSESPVDSTTDGPQFNSQGVVASATGSGHFSTPAYPRGRRFAFSAVRQADGSVKGQYELMTANGLQIHGEVTCITVVGNTARIGGIATNSETGWDGSPTWFTVVDNGEGNGAPDQISLLSANLNPAVRADLRHCDSGVQRFMRPIERGNVQVHE